MAKRPSKLKDWFVPHRGNYYKPAFFSTASIAGLLLVIVILEGAYIASTRIAFFRTDFLASVLPGTLVALTNGDREDAGVAQLTEDTLLDQAAQLKANDMAAKGYFSHVTPDGKQPWYWFDQVDYPYTYAGENLAVDFTDSKDVEDAWMKSPTHHANLVKPQYTHVGIAVAQGKYQGKQATFVVQFFAARSDESVVKKVPVAQVLAAKEVTAPVAATTTMEIERAPEVLKPAPTTTLAVATGNASSTVLGTEFTPQKAAGFIGMIATSPTHDLVYILTALIALVAIALVIAVIVKARVQYKEVIGGGLLLLLILLALLIYTRSHATPVKLPNDTQAASVYLAS